MLTSRISESIFQVKSAQYRFEISPAGPDAVKKCTLCAEKVYFTSYKEEEKGRRVGIVAEACVVVQVKGCL